MQLRPNRKPPSLFFFRPLGGCRCLSRKLSRFAKLSSIRRGIGFHRQKHVLHARFANRPGHLLSHRRLVVLQEGELIQDDSQIARIEFLDSRFLGERPRFIEAVQSYERANQVGVIKAAGVELECILRKAKRFL